MTIPRVLRTGSFRLAALYALLFGLSTGLLFGIVYWIATDSLREQLRLSLDSELAALQEVAGGSGGLAPEIARRIASNGAQPFYYALQDAGGRQIAGDLPKLPEEPGLQRLVLPEALTERDRPGAPDEPETVLLVLARRLDDGRLLSVALDTFRMTEAQEAIVRAFAWAAAAGLMLALLGGVLLSQGFLRRIDELNRAIRVIMGGHLSERIQTGGSGDELEELGRNLNEMLDRLEASMEGLKQVSNDIAHDLRTPLSRLKQRLEAVQQEETASREDYEAAVSDALEQANTALATFSALLRIAQIESGSRRANFAELDLSALLDQLAMTYAPVAEDLDRSLAARIEPGIGLRGDRELLTQLFVNLIENALRHTPAGTRIELALARDGTDLLAEVSDDGPGIPAAEREKVFRRFYRLETSRSTPGSGLGLSLVGAVAALHGIEITVGDNRPGLKVVLRFPEAGAP
ncbi:Signal transduction histidine kinase [Tistlia consotensis]|uniref:histidine kinase n=1 Tax=Tistlia consotensis USBA 355 TaxID=560819 RepID=A0A1Y6CN63_9PROT|nr:ATP-binding protein [Tistlia consotensis]SMF77748.1 Signal transduction histidine kinase [Tistlia consotensis USBA 355]SNS20683.1 Signal transduction histidine kinase [Tistlia consotensis]